MLAAFYLFLLMAGAIQGIVMGILLWRAKTSPQWKSNRFLAIMLFFFAYRLIVETLHGMGQGGVNQWIYHILLEYNWIYGCLIFFYVRSLLQPKWHLNRKDWIHFLPVSIEFLFSNFIKAQNFFWDGTAESLTWVGYHGYSLWMHTPFQFVVSIGLILYYVVRSWRLFNDMNANSNFKIKTNAHLRILWTLRIYAIFSTMALVFAFVDFIFFDYAFNPFHQYPTFISLAMVTYWLGLQGIWFRNDLILEKIKPTKKINHQLQALILQLESIMQTEKPYLNPNLNVASLAQIINTKPYLLTKALNTQLSKKFNDYINEYRVQEVIQRINDQQYEHQTLLAIGYDAGFNSKASFNRIVKKITGKSPSELKKTIH